jgi:very-short-patch-repair endonuclease
MPKHSRFARTEEISERAQDLRSEATRTEAKLWSRLCKSRMGAPFKRQHPIGPFFADYCCVPLKLVVEIDGPLHDAQQDKSRDLVMKRHGYDVMRFTFEDMDRRFRSVVETIRAEVQLRLQRQRALGTK